MNQARSLWAYVKDSPIFVYVVNKYLLWFLLPWTILLAVPGSPLAHLGQSVSYVTFISHIALILGAWSTLQAARVEVKQEQYEQAKDSEFEGRIEEKAEQIDQKVDQVAEKIVGEVKKNGHS